MKNIKSRIKTQCNISIAWFGSLSSLYAEEAFLVKGFQLSGALETLSEDAQLSVAKSLIQIPGYTNFNKPKNSTA